MSKTLEAFGSSINQDASRVLNSPSLIFLCGGRIGTENGLHRSLRALFHQRIQEDDPELYNRVLLAEDANKWARLDKHYAHLIELEDDLAGLSAAIVLFVESPGSIAELGAFCHDSVLSKKLIAVLETGRQNDESFIQDGPVALLTKHNPRSVLFYPWLGPPDECGERRLDPDAAKDAVEHLLDLIKKKTSRIAKEEKFDSQNSGHHLLLIADFVKLGTIVKKGEIKRMLTAVKIDVGQRLDRYLFLLDKLGLIAKDKYGHTFYYFGQASRNEYIHYALKSESETPDRRRLQSDLSEALKPLDRDRGDALEVYLKKSGGRNG